MAATPIVDAHAPDRLATGDDVRNPGIAALLALGWLLVYFSATTLRPPAHMPSLWYSIPETVFWAAALYAGVAAARAWHGGAIAGVVAMAAVFACPIVGHHVVGAWFPVQLVGTGALTGANLLAMEGERRRYAVAMAGSSIASK